MRLPLLRAAARRGTARSVMPLLVVALLAGTAASAAAQATPPLPADSTQRARNYARWILTAQADSLWPFVAQGGTGNFSTLDAFRSFVGGLQARAGVPGAVLEERWIWRGGARQFWHERVVSGLTEEPLVLRLVMLPDGRLGGVGASPKPNAPPADSSGPVIRP